MQDMSVNGIRTMTLPAISLQKPSTAPNKRLAQTRTRGRQWMEVTAAVILTLCFAQRGTAEAATIQVNTTRQGRTVGECSLQEAIYASEFKANTAIASLNPVTTYTTGCTAGTGNDTIVLPGGAVFTFDHVTAESQNIYGPTATPLIFSKIIIEGNGATLQWVDRFMPVNSRLFVIAQAPDPSVIADGIGELTLRNVYIKGFHTKGGNGGQGGGGGGLGAGGAIYVGRAGELTVENSTFENNGAIGGNGGGNAYTTGGGGGMSGNGGDGCSWSAAGGGGARGDGGKGAPSACFDPSTAGGAGGGGTVAPGNDALIPVATAGSGEGGFLGGGQGGGIGTDGHDPTAPGAGGGGGGGRSASACGFFQWLFGLCWGDGGDGSYGGGGGGGVGDGGHGGWGGGGGAGRAATWWVSGGDGGFGGGGGAASAGVAIWNTPGSGGRFGGRADSNNGGGGGALGGAIFNDNGTVRVRNSTFFNNFVTRGVAGGGSAANGADAGGAIFSLNNTLEVTNSTFSGNQSTGSGGAIVAYRDTGTQGGGAPVNFILNNTIIANNGANECFFTGSIYVKGAGNLIMDNGSGTAPFSKCPGVVTTADPQLQPLQLNSPGNTPTMAITIRSPAANTADAQTSLPTDQRGVARPTFGRFDIGAFEVGD